MGLVHHQPGFVFFLKLDDLGQVANIPAHGENTVGHDKFGDIRMVRKDPLQVFHVVMKVLDRLGVGKLLAIDDGGVVIAVGNDVIAPGGNGESAPRLARKPVE